jgi:hypothetical protein
MPTATSPLAKKLQLRPGHTIALVNAPPNMAGKLEPLPERATVATTGVPRDAVIAFAKVESDLNRDVLWQIVEERHGLEGVTLVAVDETWSAMRFRPRGAGKARR